MTFQNKVLFLVADYRYTNFRGADPFYEALFSFETLNHRQKSKTEYVISYFNITSSESLK